MAQFYTLEEAARVLGMSPEDLKAKAQQREVRAFLDGGSWRFRVVDIDELARRRGMGSDAELRLSDLDLPTAPGSADDLNLSEYQMGVANPDLGAPTTDLPRSGSGSDHDILLDDLSLPPGPVTGSSSVIIGMATTSRMPSDSDVRLVPDNTGSGVRPSDSDVRLASADYKKKPGKSDSDVKLKAPGLSDSDVKLKPESLSPADSDVTLIADDTMEHGQMSSPGDTAVRASPVGSYDSSSSAEVVTDKGGGLESDSDFELSPSSMMEALQPDSGSDFELSAMDESSDEFEATPMLGPGDSDVTAADPGHSGINLSRPSDSGINLQMASGLGLAGASSIELAPLSGSDIKPAQAPKSAAKPPAAKPAKPSLSETPPPSTRKGEKDIFDDTDFEVDVLESDSGSEDKTMQLEAASDFELEEADTGSEVFAIDEEDVDHNAATALGPASVLEEEEEGEEDEVDFADAASSEMGSAWDVESESGSSAVATPGARTPSPMLAAAGPAAEWDGLTFGGLCFAAFFMLLLLFVSIDLVRNLYEFQGNGPASGLVKGIAGLFG
jgi:hypothetical protein